MPVPVPTPMPVFMYRCLLEWDLTLTNTNGLLTDLPKNYHAFILLEVLVLAHSSLSTLHAFSILPAVFIPPQICTQLIHSNVGTYCMQNPLPSLHSICL